MNANHIYEERKDVSLLIKELLIKINKKLKNLGVFNIEKMNYLIENIEKDNISIHHMNFVFELVNNLKNNKRLMNYLKINDEEFFNELNIKHSFLIFYNNMFYSDIEHLMIKKIELNNSNNSNNSNNLGVV